MLSPADRAVCERDPALPGLALLLDAEALSRTLGTGALAPVYLRYKPGTSCAGGFLHPEAGALAVYAYPAARYAEVKQRGEWLAAPDVVLLDDVCVAMIPARLDRKLCALKGYFDPERRAKFLRRLLDGQGQICKGGARLLRYKPGRRLVARLDAGGRPRALLKVTAPEEFNQALIGATGAAALGGAPLLGASAQRFSLVTGWIAGQSLCPVIAGRLPEPEAIERTGAALALLHAAAFRPAARATRRQEARGLTEIAAALAALSPALGREAASLAVELGRGLRELELPGTLIHGDFSADQVVLRGDRAVILDWDQAARGDPARDIGAFLARLDAQAADGVLTAADAEAIGDALADGYGRAAGGLPQATRFQHARALLMLATEGFRIRHPEWPSRTTTLLARVEALLSGARRPRRDPAMPRLDAALDAGKARPALAAVLGRAPGDVVLAPPRLVRHKPGRRALVEYDLSTAEGPCYSLLGKLRAKGPDRTTPALHDALRAAGLDGRGGVGVPATAGVVDDLDLWLQVRIPGRPLGTMICPGADLEPLRRTGAALARLHAAGVEPTRVWTEGDELDVLTRAMRQASATLPRHADACARILEGARARLAALPPGPGCGIHRDFYFDQVVVDERTVWLLDLDLHAWGDPAIDLGNFLAHLDESALRRHGAIEALREHGAAFLAGYRGAAPAAIGSDRIAALQAVSLARHIHLSTQFEDRAHTTDRLVALSLAALAPAAPAVRLLHAGGRS